MPKNKRLRKRFNTEVTGEAHRGRRENAPPQEPKTPTQKWRILRLQSSCNYLTVILQYSYAAGRRTPRQPGDFPRLRLYRNPREWRPPQFIPGAFLGSTRSPGKATPASLVGQLQSYPPGALHRGKVRRSPCAGR